MASSSTIASPNDFYHIFINHRGVDVKKTLASHLYHRLRSAHPGLRVFLDKPELRAGNDFPSQIKEAIRTASVHVAIFSRGYAESEWCLNELFYMLESGAPIIPVFYHVQPADLRRTQSKLDGVYYMGLRKLESRHDSTTLQKWRGALSRVADISGLDLQETCNGDEGELVEKVVQRVLEEIPNIMPVQDLYVSQKYGGTGGGEWNEGPYSGVTRIIVTANQYSLISLQMCYVSNVSSRRIYRQGDVLGGVAGPPHWGAVGDKIEYRLKYPDEILTKVSGHFGGYKPPPESWVVIKSLTFHTNKGTYGPCGQEEGTPFETEEGGTIIGFQGRCGTLLDSIGVYMHKPITSDNEARQNGENEDNQIIPSVITLEDEAGESGENEDDQIMPALISAEDDAGENAENKDDQINCLPRESSYPILDPLPRWILIFLNWLWNKVTQFLN